MGDDAMRSWLIDHDGAGLDSKKLRYWQLILNIPELMVSAWIRSTRENPWNRRMKE